FAMKSAFRFFNSCYNHFMTAKIKYYSSALRLFSWVPDTKKAAGCYPCGRFRAHIAITAA
ncbi:hypothetical protein MZI65_23520, partial [Escherichia coli]|nr:hypothetical protein [Escherichia coli]